MTSTKHPHILLCEQNRSLLHPLEKCGLDMKLTLNLDLDVTGDILTQEDLTEELSATTY